MTINQETPITRLRVPLFSYLWVFSLVLLSCYCTDQEGQSRVDALSQDESYLVDSYSRIVEARDLYAINHLKSESLFTLLDSTIDTLRIANTIRELDMNPDRWLIVFRSIEQKVKNSSQGQESE